jgi:tetratricopeptide (TPR) repeat protein
MRPSRLPSVLLVLPLLALADGSSATVPITTSSSEARALYLQARDLNERLKGSEANAVALKAVEKDPNFATGWLLVAQTAGTAKGFFEAQAKAKALAGKTSEGERLFIVASDAGAQGKPAEQRQALEQLVQKYPKDPRTHAALGLLDFGNQDWDGAIKELSKASELEPSYTTPYNQLGYAYRFQGKYPEAEKTFQKYAELLPDDPNPHDSYAELLMRMGRFDDSIGQYRKALAVDPYFQSAYIGIANNQVFQGKGDDARKALKEGMAKARNDGEKRALWFWTSVTYSHEGRYADAQKAVEDEKKIADASGDYVSASQDVTLMGNIALAAGKPADAAARFDESQKLLAKAKVSDEVKDNARRNNLFNQGRVALKKGDLEGAKALSAKYSAAVEVKKIPFEQWQAHELAGMVALQSKDFDTALKELGQASNQNPRVIYLTGLAYQGKGDSAKAAEAFKATADWNQLNGLLAFVRSDARRQLGRS